MNLNPEVIEAAKREVGWQGFRSYSETKTLRFAQALLDLHAAQTSPLAVAREAMLLKAEQIVDWQLDEMGPITEAELIAEYIELRATYTALLAGEGKDDFSDEHCMDYKRPEGFPK